VLPLLRDPAYVRGTVPWSLDDLLVVLDWTRNLQETPKDDWDLKPRAIGILDDFAEVPKSFEFNMFHPMNQVGIYFMRKYGAPLGAYHLNRFFEIQGFLSTSRERLIKDQWIRSCQDGSKGEEIATTLLAALCCVQYTHRDTTAEIEHWVFDYEAVTDKARDLGQEHGNCGDRYHN
jgi:hypothetical protein